MVEKRGEGAGAQLAGRRADARLEFIIRSRLTSRIVADVEVVRATSTSGTQQPSSLFSQGLRSADSGQGSTAAAARRRRAAARRSLRLLMTGGAESAGRRRPSQAEARC